MEDQQNAGLEYGIDLSLDELIDLKPDQQLPFLWEHARKMGLLGQSTNPEVAARAIEDLRMLFHHQHGTDTPTPAGNPLLRQSCSCVPTRSRWNRKEVRTAVGQTLRLPWRSRGYRGTITAWSKVRMSRYLRKRSPPSCERRDSAPSRAPTPSAIDNPSEFLGPLLAGSLFKFTWVWTSLVCGHVRSLSL